MKLQVHYHCKARKSNKKITMYFPEGPHIQYTGYLDRMGLVIVGRKACIAGAVAEGDRPHPGPGSREGVGAIKEEL